MNTLTCSPRMSAVIKGVNYLVWYGYLVWLFLVSFANQPYQSRVWLFASGVLYALFSLYLCLNLFSQKKRWRALTQAKLPIALIAMMVGWLLLQLLLPISSPFDDFIFGSGAQPDWFVPQSTASIVPERTKWLLLSQLMISVLFVFTLCLLDRRQRVKELVFTLLFVGLVHTLVAVFAKYSGLYLVDKVSLDGHFDAARGMFVNRNHFAAFVSLCLISVIAMQVKLLMINTISCMSDLLYKQFIRISFLLLMVGLSAIFLSESRGAFLAFFVSLCITLSMFGNTKKLNIKRHYVITIMAVLVVILSLFFGHGMFERFVGDGLMLGERSEQWSITYAAIKNSSWLGYGGGSYELVFQAYRQYTDLRVVVYDQAHNDYLHIFLEQGVVGLLIWLSFLVCIIRSVIREYGRSKSTLTLSIIFSGSVVILAVLIQSFVDYPLQIITIRSYFFVIIGLLLSVPYVRHNH